MICYVILCHFNEIKYSQYYKDTQCREIYHNNIIWLRLVSGCDI